MDDNNRRIKDKNYLTATTIFYPTAAMIGDRVLRVRFLKSVIILLTKLYKKKICLYKRKKTKKLV